MELALPKAQGNEAGKGRKHFNINNHKFSWKIKCRGRKKTPKQPNKTQKHTKQKIGKSWKSETSSTLSQNFLTKDSLSI